MGSRTHTCADLKAAQGDNHNRAILLQAELLSRVQSKRHVYRRLLRNFVAPRAPVPFDMKNAGRFQQNVQKKKRN